LAESKAKRLRKKMSREGKLDPSIKRHGWNGVNPVQRVKHHSKRRLIEEAQKRDEY